ncbi:alpha-2-macroglobulin family protein [Chryseolinea sp. T2]|uniref:alpha-2-macroglobulin family protein n=1 Tax=Chryseolinea sp. T2 TaxID=3129255 RepID=UPI0030776138
MTKKQLLHTALWVLIIHTMIYVPFACAQSKTGSMTPFDYNKAWREVQEFDDKQLPESALKAVNIIYEHAKQDNNAGQLVKAVVHQLKFAEYKEDNAVALNLNRIRTELATASFPVKPLLHSMLGEMYWQYYQSNRYRFQDRTRISNDNDDDITTWSLDKIVAESFSQYRQSLLETEKSKATNISIYDDILYKGNTIGRRYRPTLYDFLAHRALDFAQQGEASINRPANSFVLIDEQYFQPALKFATLTIPQEDSLSMDAFSLTLIQDLIRFHLEDKDVEPLADIDIRRLVFLFTNHKSPRKQELYLSALTELEKRTITHPVSTRVTHLKASVFDGMASLYSPLQGDAHKWDRKRALEICDSAIARFRDSEGAVHCENLRNSIKSKSLEATIEEVNVPGLPFRGLVKYRNITSLYYRAVRVTRAEVQAERKKWERNYKVDQEQKFIEYFTAKKALKSGRFDLPDDKDFQQHSVEIKVDELPVGEYIILVSNRDDFSTSKNAVAYAFTTISNMAYIHRSAGDNSTDCFVISRTTGEPLAGVRADIYKNIYDYKVNRWNLTKIGTYSTDAKGYFRIPFQKDGERNFHMEFTHKEDKIHTSPIDTRGYYEGNIYQYESGETHRELRTHFFLDRSIYRPGQSIFFKGLVVNTDGRTSEIVTRHKTTLALYDVNHQVRQEIEVTSNEFGTFSGVFTAPASGLTGEMYIQDQGGTGSAHFSVEEYKRPKFEVVWDTLKGSYRLNDIIKASGSAAAYAGNAIDQAKVVYRVVRNARYPIWWSYWRIAPTSPSLEITHGETVTDTSGKFEVSFTAIPDLSIDPATDPTFDYTLYADVTDINGETHSQSTTVSVGYKSLLLNVSVGNIDVESLGGKEKVVAINTSNFNGQFEPAKGTIKIFALRQPNRLFRSRLWSQPDRSIYPRDEFYKLFPRDLYEDELNKHKWEKDKQIMSASFDTQQSKSIVLAGANRWSPGEYVLEGTTTDRDGKEVKYEEYFTVFSPKSNTPPVHSIFYFQPSKLAGEPGDKAGFALGTSDKNIRVLYELELDGKLLSSEWVSLSTGQRHFEIPLKEEYRGNITLHLTSVRDSRLYKEDRTIVVPRTNKMLDVVFETFRDKLLPGQAEQWKLLIKGKNADKVAAEMVASLYDESLDSFRPHDWSADLFGTNASRLNWSSANGFDTRDLSVYSSTWNQFDSRYVETADFDRLNWFEFSLYSYRYASRRYKKEGSAYKMAMPAAPAEAEMVMEEKAVYAQASAGGVMADSTAADKNTSHDSKGQPKAQETPAPPKTRSNFNETAFFFPHLQTNDKGEVIINFTVPEALTRWKMLGFAHTKSLQHSLVTNHLVTQKELMVAPNQPRFFREGDKMMFSVKVSSLVDKSLEGKAQLEFIDPFTGKVVNLLSNTSKSEQPFSIAPKQSTTVDWNIEIPEGLQAVTYRVHVTAGNVSDGEEMTIPVVTNRMLVTETLPLPIRGKQSKDFRFEKLINNKSQTLRHQQFTLEFTSNPAWYAIQALPYLMEYPYDCIEQTFSKFYANSIAAHIANSNPRIKQVFDTWRTIQPDALLSKLEKNQELKSALLEETPWVLQSNNESERKRNVALLFDLNRMGGEQERALQKIAMAQSSNGGFPWFPGMPEDRYMTQHIVAGLGHLDRMGVIRTGSNAMINDMLSKAVSYLDHQIEDDYERLKALAAKKQLKLEDRQIGYTQIQYLYARSYFTTLEIPAHAKSAFDYYIGQAKKYWQWNNIYIEGLSALALSRFGDQATPAAMIKSFRERALTSEEMGMYWKSERGYYWYQAPIEAQALMIEVFDEVAKDREAVEAQKVWLLKQKQTQDWKTTKATSEACYALLMRGTDLLTKPSQVDIVVGKERIDPATRPDIKAEAGTGYFKTSWQASEITSTTGDIHIEKHDDGVAWGAAYWQYFEQLDKITPASTPLSLKKQLFIEQLSNAGPVLTAIDNNSAVKRGDQIVVRLEIRVDRDMEYVHIKDMRASGFEPVSTLSTYRYQDGLHYYESTRDMATNFFIGYLRKATYVFEYKLRASQKGDFSNGITTIQCMYAPEFTSHSAGIRVQIK